MQHCEASAGVPFERIDVHAVKVGCCGGMGCTAQTLSGVHAVTATYSGSTNGVWLPSTASATYTIPTGCAGDGVWTSLQVLLPDE